MDREYIKIKKTSPLPDLISHQRELNDDFWKDLVFYHLLTFYKNYDSIELKNKIGEEKTKTKSDIEDAIALYIRKYLRNDRMFDLQGFKVAGGVNNDNDKKGLYDITILRSYWKNEFHFECKNLDNSQDLVNKYVFYDKGHKEFDGGVYRYFNGKYAQNQHFGGMIGFLLDGEEATIKSKIIEKLRTKFDVSPEGDLKNIIHNSINENEFTFNSVHIRKGVDFILHHLLFNFS